MKPLLYDICCGAGGATKGYQLAGFHVVGVDYKPFKRYCGDGFIEMDALRFLEEYGNGEHPMAVAIAASFPCQKFCAFKHMPNAKEHPDLVTPGRELLIKIGLPYVIENVPGAPLRNPTVLCGTMFGLGTGDAELRRHRLFETNWPLVLPMGMHCKHGRRAAQTSSTITIAGGTQRPGTWWSDRLRAGLVKGGEKYLPKSRRQPGGQSVRNGLIYFSTAERNEAMNISWMKGAEISQAIPPPYTEFIGRQIFAYVTSPAKAESPQQAIF